MTAAEKKKRKQYSTTQSGQGGLKIENFWGKRALIL